ncbi:putative membrane protein [Salinibacterium sp. CAN_S4]|uniref:DUF2269 family protein n=1 Tax=Salinibacterium sp. CAN_S4 TaxID=2787727 RepID=UPI0018EF70A5
METLFAVLHVTAAVFIIGPMAILPMTGLRAVRAGNAEQVTSIARSTRLVSWLSLLVALIGFALVSFVDPEDKLTFGTPWLLASIILYTVAVTVSLSVVAPLLGRAGRHLTAASTPPSNVYGRIAGSSGLVTLLLVAVVVLMVWRP